MKMEKEEGGSIYFALYFARISKEHNVWLQHLIQLKFVLIF